MIVVTWRSLYLVPVCDVIDFIINLERMAKWCRERTPNDDDLAGECARCFRLKMAVVPYSQHFTCDVAPPSTPIIHISFWNERALCDDVKYLVRTVVCSFLFITWPFSYLNSVLDPMFLMILTLTRTVYCVSYIFHDDEVVTESVGRIFCMTYE